LVIIHKRTLSNVPLLLAGAEITIAVLCIDQWIIKVRERDNNTRGNKPASSTTQTIEPHTQDVRSLLAALRWAVPRWETAQEKLAYLEEMVPDPDKEPDSLELVSAPNVVGERQQGNLDLPKIPQDSTAIVTSSRPDVPRLGSHVSALADVGVATISSSTRHTRRQEEGPRLTDLSRQYVSPQPTSVPSTPRISSSHSFLPRIRARNPAEQPTRSSLDDWAGSQKSSYPMPPSLLPISGNPHPHSHGTSDSNNSPEFARVKHESDAGLSVPQAPLRLGWEFMTHPPSVHTWEASGVRGSQNDAGTAREGSRSSLLSHLHRPARDFTAPSPYGTDGREPE